MRPSSAEELQVASYAFGGHYEVHMDALRLTSETMDRGDRIATFMFYLTDVEKGGSTAFPMAGVAARPVKGSAVFWNNLFSSGNPDERTWHGACPVIMGEKWVANKWIRYFDQMQTHQCKSQQPSQMDFKVNGKKLKFKQPVVPTRR
ncbi:unnamed protein product [Allacma fusca]|uniref:Fe2OG dioxygenase domain-containing protein n=1 Tax=Allacma fusca TaxID=39272 RepID=A0A8J2LPM8_9HEXA|nr:unnamed protein product [Allacma fusca]